MTAMKPPTQSKGEWIEATARAISGKPRKPRILHGTKKYNFSAWIDEKGGYRVWTWKSYYTYCPKTARRLANWLLKWADWKEAQ